MNIKSISEKAAKWRFNNYTMEEFCFSSYTCKKAKRLRPDLKIDLQILIPVAVVERTHSGGLAPPESLTLFPESENWDQVKQ